MSHQIGPPTSSLQSFAAGEGVTLSVGASTVLVGPAEWSGGTFNVMDQIVPAGLLVPPHVHEHEAQVAFVISGAIGFWVDGEELELTAGGYIHRPAGKPHALWNATAEPARMLEITSPAAGFEEYMRGVSDLTDTGRATPAAVAELAAGYGITFVPERMDELGQRHGVSPAGGFWK